MREVGLEKCRECFSLFGLGILVFLSILYFSWQHLQCVRAGYAIEELKAERAAQQEWNHQLRMEQAALADPQRIDTLARKDLGMVSPSPQQVIQWAGAEAPSPSQPGSAEFARNFAAVGEGNADQP
jgi:cell division protein FtsL